MGTQKLLLAPSGENSEELSYELLREHGYLKPLSN